jgi:subtilase family serine protease
MKWKTTPAHRARRKDVASNKVSPRRPVRWRPDVEPLEEVVLLSAANLVVSSAVAPTTLYSSATSTVEWTVSNRGTEQATASWADSVYLSTDATLDDGDIVLGGGPNTAPTTLAPGESYTVDRNFVIPAADSGDYYLIFATDSGKVQDEASEGDNTRAVPVSLVGSSGKLPDLIVSNATAPSSAVLGRIDISFTVKNQGTSATPGFWSNAVYLSTDATYDFFDTNVASDFEFSPLNAGSSFTINPTANLPGVAAGQYYLLFIADSNHSVTESDETNNVRALPITLTAPNVDLAATAATAPTTAKAGDTPSVSWTVRNNGTDQASATWSDYVYLSTDNQYDFSDSYVSSFYNPGGGALAGGASYVANQTITLPGVSAGDYYLLFVADGSHSQAETDENNNVFAVPITLTAANVDLEATDAHAPASTVPGPIDLSWTVTNQGTDAASAAWYDYVYLSTDDKVDSFDSYVASSYHYSSPALGAGSGYTRNATANLSWVAPGNYYLLFVTDAYNFVNETDEDNNVRALPITVTNQNVDLVVTSINAPATAAAGDTITISWTVKNQGSDPAGGPWYDSVYLSSDDQYDWSDQYVGLSYTYANSPIAAGDSYTKTLTVSLPEIVAGNYYLLVVADDSNNLGESNEDNNVGAAGIAITASQGEVDKADLAVEGISSPASASAGEYVSVTWTVFNFGTAAADGHWLDGVYLSTDPSFDPTTDTELSSISIASQRPLPEGGGYIVSMDVFLPSALASGDYYLLFAANSDDGQDESNRDNNVSARSVNIIGATPALPDLIVTSVTAPTSAIVPGENFTIDWTVKNQGVGDANNYWRDYIYLSPTATFDPTTAISRSDSWNTSTLVAGASYTREGVISIPRGTAPGNYYIVIYTDQNNSQEEASDSNNTLAVSIVVRDSAVPAPTVQSFLVNDGEAQRSMVTHLTLTFGAVVTIDDGAFALERAGGGESVAVTATSRVEGDRTIVTLTFSGNGIVAGSLADGRYTLTVLADKVHSADGQALDGNGDGAAGGDYIDELFRLFGDANGDGVVDNADYFFFRSTAGKKAGQAGFLWYLDSNGDGTVDLATDYAAFVTQNRKTKV